MLLYSVFECCYFQLDSHMLTLVCVYACMRIYILWVSVSLFLFVFHHLTTGVGVCICPDNLNVPQKTLIVSTKLLIRSTKIVQVGVPAWSQANT